MQHLLINVICIIILKLCLLTNFISVAAVETNKSRADKENKEFDLVRFFLYSNPRHQKLNSGEELKSSDLNTILSSNFKRGKEVKFFIHGFVHNYTCWFPQELKDASLEYGLNDNIIAVDWGTLATPQQSLETDYAIAVENVPIVAKEIASLIFLLRDNGFVENLNSIYLIGFSLGAHVAGSVGKTVQERYHEKIGRITGLDPAGPLFTTGRVIGGLGRSLRKSDADYVDIIHTAMGESGTFLTLGHADFYPNGGRSPQPGCGNNGSNFLTSLESCSHAAAPNYFLQTIKRKGNQDLLACPCDSYELYLDGLCECEHGVAFGANSKPGTFGKFFFRINPVALSGKYKC